MISVTGFLYQTQDVFQVYFEYQTLTHVKIVVPVNVSAPDVSLCVRYVDVFAGEYNISTTGSSDTATDAEALNIRTVQDRVTLKEIFSETPDENQLMSNCLMRKPRDYKLFRLNGSECYERFKINNFFTQEYICYRFTLLHNNQHSGFTEYDPFTLRNETYYSYQNLAFPPSYPSMFYGIMINKSMVEGADMCKVVVNNADSLPVNAIAYAPSFFRRVNKTSKYNFISAGYTITQVRKLPPPYNTRCRSYSKFGYEKKGCLNSCLKNKTLKEFNKIPFNIIEEEELDLKHMSVFDLDNETIAESLDQFEKECEDLCSQQQCLREYYSTSLLKEENGESNFFSINVYSPMKPIISVQTKAVFSIEDFLIYVATIFGIWFGVSIFSLNPSKMKKWINKRNMASHRRTLDHSCLCDSCQMEFDPLLQQLSIVKNMTIY
jgi:hypothetical protein